jgi:hypothetical protein
MGCATARTDLSRNTVADPNGRNLQESRPNLGALLVAFVISFTSVTVVLVGILAAYAAVTGILHAFAYRSRQRARGTPLLVPSQSQVSGD